MKIIANVYEENDYSVFKRLDDNRDVFESRVKKLIASMTERYILNPIIVNEKMEIIDGQGRFEARKAMGKPIHYIMVRGATSDDCRRMNKYNTSWKALDYARSYAKGGKVSYINLLDTCKRTGYSIARVLRLSNHGSARDTEMNKFETGSLVFSNTDIQTVLAVSDHIKELETALQVTHRVNDAFCNGVKVVMETKGYIPERMIKKCAEERGSFAQMSKLGDQLKEFERIYNKGLSPKNRLYFSDYMRNKGVNVRDYDKSYTPYDDIDISTLD